MELTARQREALDRLRRACELYVAGYNWISDVMLNSLELQIALITFDECLVAAQVPEELVSRLLEQYGIKIGG